MGHRLATGARRSILFGGCPTIYLVRQLVIASLGPRMAPLAAERAANTPDSCIWLYRLYAFIGRHPTNFGIRRRLGPLIAAAKAPFSIPARMRLYQFYSFVGRQPTGFGIRKRVSRLIAKAKAPFLIPPRMRLYQFYSFIGRHPTNFGIRRRLRTLFSKGSFS